jgi:hypothetical protein
VTPAAPAFMVYAADEDAALAALPLAAVGAFHRLRLHQWVMGSIPDPSTPAGLGAVASVLRVAPAEARRLRPFIEQLFALGADGVRRWAPLEEYRRKLEEHRRAMVEGGRRGGRTKWDRARAASDQPASQPTSVASSPPSGPPNRGPVALQSPTPFPSPPAEPDPDAVESAASAESSEDGPSRRSLEIPPAPPGLRDSHSSHSAATGARARGRSGPGTEGVRAGGEILARGARS